MKLKNQSEKRKPKNSGKHCLHFEIEAPPGSTVFVAGDFNKWCPTSHRMSERGHPGVFRRNVYVDSGRFEYKFLIEDEWHIDPNCARWVPNRFGSLNSIAEA